MATDTTFSMWRTLDRKPEPIAVAELLGVPPRPGVLRDIYRIISGAAVSAFW